MNTLQEARWAKSEEIAMREAGEVAQSILERYQNMTRKAGSIEAEAVIVQSAHLAEDGYPHCEYCNDARFVVQEFTKLGRVVETKTIDCPRCNVAIKKRMKALQKYSSVSEKSLAQSFANYSLDWDSTGVEIRRKLLTACKQFAAAPKGFLVVYGSYGCGKSHLCAAIYNEIVGRNKPIIFISMLDLMRSLKALFNDKNEDAERETYEHRLSIYQKIDVLILDDIGAGRMTEFDESVLTELVDYRYRNQLPTVFVSNLDMTDRRSFNPRLVERWNEVGMSTIIGITAPSYRTGEI